jgi:hypothetical protein
MRDLKCVGKRIFVMRHSDKMNMIAHEAVRKNGKIEFSAIIGGEKQILPSVGIILEYILPIVTSLGNMMRISRNNYSRNTWHGEILSRQISKVNKIGVCP